MICLGLAILICKGVVESFDEISPEVFISFLSSVICGFLKFQELFSFPGIDSSTVHVAEHGNDSVERFLHGVIVSVYCMPQVPIEFELDSFVSVSIEYKWRISFECAIRGISDNIDPLRILLDLASSNVNFFLLSFHSGWMIWGVGAGRKLLKCCGNCCDSERDAGLLFVKGVVGMLRV